MSNEAGIYPSGDRVLVSPDELEEVTEGGIIIPKTVSDRHAWAQSIGILVAVGPDAWIDHVERDGQGRVTKVVGYSQPFAKPGDRVIYAKYGGVQVTGKDGKTYRIMNDADITGTCEEGVDFTDIKSRKRFAE